MLAQTRLKELLDYNPFSGLFTWKVRRNNRALVGSVAGTLDGDGYCRISIDSKLYRAHRLAFLWMTGALPKDQVDHIDLNRSNNAWENLREASNSENGCNKRKQKNNASGYKGVCKHSEGKFRADINLNGKPKFLGLFDAPELAHAAYCEAASTLHGQFERTA